MFLHATAEQMAGGKAVNVDTIILLFIALNDSKSLYLNMNLYF
jgi:hypothetical protein